MIQTDAVSAAVALNAKATVTKGRSQFLDIILFYIVFRCHPKKGLMWGW